MKLPHRLKTFGNMAKKEQTKHDSSLSVRSIGTGEIVPSPKNGPTNEYFVATDGDDSFFVVQGFKALASKWLICKVPGPSNETKSLEITKEKTSTEYDTIANRTDSNSSLSEREDDKVTYDLTTDLAYHNISEREGADLIHTALTPQEQSAMPDAFMPLRHYRAEKVGLVES